MLLKGKNSTLKSLNDFYLKHNINKYVKNIGIVFLLCSLLLVSFHFIGYCKEQKAIKEAHMQEVYNTINTNTFYDGIIVSGINLSGKTLDQAKEIIHSIEPSIPADIDIDVIYNGETITSLTNDDFVFTYDTDEVLEKAYNIARDGTDEERYNKVMSLKNSPEVFVVSAYLNFNELERACSKVNDIIYVKPQDAHFVNIVNKKANFSEGADGIELNATKFKEDLIASLKSPKSNKHINALSQPLLRNVYLKDIDTNVEVISSFSTIAYNTQNAKDNMKLALDSINGTSVLKGESFSFNAITGDSNDPSKGYKQAGAISNGKLINSFGGGICQAATTIYGAALRANMTITERHNHQWPSTYVPTGQDATINYPTLDLKFQNDTGHNVYINSYMEGSKLICEFYGTKPQDYDYIDVTSQKTNTIPMPNVQYINDSSIPAGTSVKEIKGQPGSCADGEKIFYKNSQEIKREGIPSSYYPPIAPIIRVNT